MPGTDQHDGDVTAPINYADGAEARVLELLRATDDTAAGSQSLAEHVTSWELAHHFAPQRLGLLGPLRLGPDLRIVDVGCGSGVLTRALGETGADVLGLEGAPARAKAAAARCRDLANVRIAAGPVRPALAAAGPRDLALLCGVLEYSQKYGAGPAELLAATAGALTEDGVLVLAIENQLGLRYLLGGTEGHHGSAWTGLADYPGGARAPRTWPAGRLRALLAGAGFTAQRWLLPYPDHKLPRLVLDAAVFERPDAAELVDKLVREPLRGIFGGNDAAVAGRALHRIATAEGIGARLASSFLVVAARTPAALAARVEPGLAWLNNDGRRPQWRRLRRLDADLVLRTVRSGQHRPGIAEHAWLRQQPGTEEPFRPGPALDALLLDALRTADSAGLRGLLGRWRAAGVAGGRPGAPDDQPHPFLPGRAGVPVLPPDRLDIHPGNFVVAPGGELVRVDREWLAGDGVDAELALLRALLEFAREIVLDRAPHPWSATASVRDVLAELCAAADLAGPLARRWTELLPAEAALQHAVGGGVAADIEAAIAAEVDAPAVAALWTVPGGLNTLRANHATATQAAADLRAATDWFADQERHLRTHRETLEAQVRRLGDEHRQGLEDHRRGLEDHRRAIEDHRRAAELMAHELGQATAALREKDDRIAAAFAELTGVVHEVAATEAARAAAEAEAAGLRGELTLARGRLAEVEGTSVVRLARRSLWPAGTLVRGTRELLLARPGRYGDSLLRRLTRSSPGLSARLTARYRRAALDTRLARLRFDLPLPAEPLGAGRPAVLTVDGWIAHPDLAVRSATMVVGRGAHAMSVGHHRPDVTAFFAGGGQAVPADTGVRVSVPLAAGAEPVELAVRVRVELVDGTLLDRELGSVRVVASGG